MARAAILLVAYSGMRWGEHTALAADRVRAGDRRLSIDRQIVETPSRLKPGLPKSRRRRVTMYPARTPGGVDLAAMVERRLAEIDPEDLLFTAPKGGWLRRSNWGRYVWDRAAADVDWPRSEDGTWQWTFHSLRHVVATWALHEARIPIEHASRLLGHFSTRVTQDIYVHVRPDLYDRFFKATG